MTGVGSTHVRLYAPAAPTGVATGPAGIAGGMVETTFRTMARIMSFSSWLRMWQCHTYSQAKLTTVFVVGGTSGACVMGLTLVKP